MDPRACDGRTTVCPLWLFGALLSCAGSQPSHHVLAETVDRALAGERDERDLARLARLETNRRARGNVEPHTARSSAVELQRRVGFEEMVMRANLDRAVAGIGDGNRRRLAPGVERDLAVLDEHFAGNHE